jgi:hypothetical protein
MKWISFALGLLLLPFKVVKETVLDLWRVRQAEIEIKKLAPRPERFDCKCYVEEDK